MIWNKTADKFGKNEMFNVDVRIQEKRSEQCIKATANVTRTYLEGIKGAEATASAIYMARK